ncbi:MAG: hypothetical protein ABSB61_12320 [Anaerolineales bacterium]
MPGCKAVNKGLLEALLDLTALYASTPGRDPVFVAKGRMAIDNANQVPANVRYGIFGCINRLWNCIECKGGSKHDREEFEGQPTCKFDSNND